VGRIRTIKPEFPESESVGRLSRDARLLFVLLWTFVDDSGRARASSRLLASRLYPYDEDAADLLDGWLDELQANGHVRLYEVDGNTYLDIPKWLKHQKIDRPSASRFPAFDEASTKPRRTIAAHTLDLGPVPRTLDQGPREDPAAIAAPPVEDAHEQVAEVQVVDDRGPEVLPSSPPAAGDLPAACADQPSLGGMGAALGMGAEALGDGNRNLGGNGKARRASDDARDAWNTVAARCGWPTVQRFSDARQKRLIARLAEIGGFDGWQTMLAKAEASDFLSGRASRSDGHSNWAFTFDWATKPDNLTKIMEGNYDNKSPGAPAANGRGPTAGFAAAALALRDKQYSGL